MIDTKRILDYLFALKMNNNREWYAAHKDERKLAEAEFENLIAELIVGIGKFDERILFNNPKDLTFKLVRDTRFSHDKSPYNPTFRAHISAKGKLPIPVGYYISISPENMSFLGGGLFADMFADATTMIRDHIAKYPEELKQIINETTFKKDFVVEGTKLKNVPKGYSSENCMAEYLKHKSFYLEYMVDDDVILDADQFIKMAVKKFHVMLPFQDYLNEALVSFEMPTR